MIRTTINTVAVETFFFENKVLQNDVKYFQSVGDKKKNEKTTRIQAFRKRERIYRQQNHKHDHINKT